MKADYPYFQDPYFQELRDVSFEECPDNDSIHLQQTSAVSALQEVQKLEFFNSNDQQNFAHLSETNLTDNMQGNGTFYESHHEHPQAVQNRESRSKSKTSKHFAHAREQRRQQAKRHNDKLSTKIEKLRNILRCDSNCTRLKVLDKAIQALEKR